MELKYKTNLRTEECLQRLGKIIKEQQFVNTGAFTEFVLLGKVEGNNFTFTPTRYNRYGGSHGTVNGALEAESDGTIIKISIQNQLPKYIVFGLIIGLLAFFSYPTKNILTFSIIGIVIIGVIMLVNYLNNDTNFVSKIIEKELDAEKV